MTIAQTGTTVVHAMGYPLTYFTGCPTASKHLVCVPEVRSPGSPAKSGEVMVALGLTSLLEFEQLMEDLFKDVRRELQINPADLPAWAQRSQLRRARLTPSATGLALLRDLPPELVG